MELAKWAVAVLVAVVCIHPSGASRGKLQGMAAVTPIQKVLTLMSDMLAKAKKEKEQEANRMSAFSQWCDDQKRIKTGEIQVGEEQMELLDAAILKADARIRALTDRILELEEDVGRWQKDMASATDVRKKEEADYTATLQDYSESLDAVTEAIAVLKKQEAGTPQTELVQALVQVQRRPNLPLAAKSALTAFLQQAQPSVEEMPDDQLFNKAPKAYAYEFQSGGVVDMLIKLKDQFYNQKSELMSDELKAKHAYEVIMQQLTDNIEIAQNEISKKTSLRAEVQQAKAEAEGALAMTTTELNEDKKYLAEAEALCTQKTNDFESRQELRAEEIATLQKAIEIISSSTVAGAGEKHLPTMLQSGARPRSALAQLQGGQQNPLQERIAAFLAERARLSGSRLLSQVSQRVAADPFKKVKKLIKDLIVQLMEEATAEVEHKGWCDTELATNKQTREKKTEEVNSLTSEIEDLTATIAQLTDDLAALAAGIKELEEAMAKATADRTASKETNLQTIEDAKAAQVAVQQAMAVVKEYYAKSAQATALAQQTPDMDAPETFDKPYKGMLPEGGNVVDFLEVILTDFTRLESETSSAEATEQDEYEKFMFESKKDKALKENESEHKDAKKSDKESALHSAEEELKTTQEQLSAAVAYYEKLKPTCVDSGVTYEERVKRREEEIQSLQEALKILSGEDIA
uniref:Uncharacterized protein n=1 Tax=Pyrodinium bahamense TaxID=73915 RepID=A0A7S0A6D7_9DINO|mmetsp:Transcript_24085/g.66442  ORF Transcript_24085/g.66442 Transcript_24085/m.66442 type:complete len:692 (+) Transcript_24085:58-2133(+)